MGMLGFIENCKIAWKMRGKIGTPLAHVPMLHSNTSVLEAYFSLVQSCERDAPLKCPRIVGAMDTINKMMAME